MKKKTLRTFGILVTAGTLLAGMLTGCGNTGDATVSAAVTSTESVEATASTEVNETIEDTTDGGHAILADGEEASYSNIGVNKTGDAEGDEADFYGDNAAIFATNGATLNLDGLLVTTNGTHANAVFSYGEGTTVNISDSVIETSGNCSGGIMTTGGGTMNAENLTIHTTGNSSAAIRSDRGGGTVTVTGGTYTTDGTGSPAIYSTADITVNDAELTSTASQGVVVEGQNSVTLNNVTLNADNNTKNSDKSDFYQAVMIYQSMSGDADQGVASFTMNGGTLTNQNGDIFFVNNTVAEINLDNVSITNNGDGVFLRAAAAGWGTEGSNGGLVKLTASNQTIDGDMVVDSVSSLNLYLTNGSVFTGAISQSGTEGSSSSEAGDVYVELTDGSIWTLTADSYITSLTCDADSIDLNGHTLYVNGEAYTEGTAMTGEAIEQKMSSGGQPGEMGERPEGAPEMNGEAPSDMGNPPEMNGEAPSDMGNPPEMNGEAPSGGMGAPGGNGQGAPDGNGSTPPEKPGE